jgi:hypothetical protein
MPTPELADLHQLSPKTITPTHFLSQALTQAANTFELGGKQLQLGLINSKAAAVHRFALPPATATKLGRKDSVVEAVASGIDPRSPAIREIRSYLTRIKVNSDIATKSSLFFVSLRRRDETRAGVTSGDILHVSKQFATANENSFVLGLALNATGHLVATILHPDFHWARPQTGGSPRPPKKKGGGFVLTFPLSSEGATSPPLPVVEDKPDPENTQDFAACYGSCMANVPAWMLAIASGTCAACIAAISAATLAAPAIAVACTACALAVGLLLGNCLLECHEML